jgi:hypothetical protein
LKGLAKFIAYVQEESGRWGQRYGLNGQNKAIYIQEDNTAYGAIILANYLLTCYSRQEEPEELEIYLTRIKKQSSMHLNIFIGRKYSCFSLQPVYMNQRLRRDIASG